MLFCLKMNNLIIKLCQITRVPISIVTMKYFTFLVSNFCKEVGHILFIPFGSSRKSFFVCQVVYNPSETFVELILERLISMIWNLKLDKLCIYFSGHRLVESWIKGLRDWLMGLNSSRSTIPKLLFHT